MPSGTLRILEATYSLLGCVLQPIYQVTQKAANFEWGPEQEKALQQVQAVLPLGHIVQQIQWCLKYR